MAVSLFQSSFSSPFQDTQIKSRRDPNLLSLPKSLFPNCERVFRRSSSSSSTTVTTLPSINASLIDNPVMWAGRLCVYYALLKAGLVGSSATPLILEGNNTDLGFSKWFEGLQGRSEEKEATNRRKLVKNWHPTTKGTLKRSYRVTSKSVGQRLLKAIAALLSDDDVFLDAASHKGCQIRRESAHGESVCCNNVRALFDELPTPHLVLEITAFPAGPLTEKDYAKAEKLEKVLRSGFTTRPHELENNSRSLILGWLPVTLAQKKLLFLEIQKGEKKRHQPLVRKALERAQQALSSTLGLLLVHHQS